MSDYSCYLISNNIQTYSGISKSLEPETLKYFDGANYPSFSKLVNDCVHQADTETVIIMSNKVLPTVEHVKKTLNLLQDGFAFVALYRFGFFAFNKELFRKIGPLDERFVGGGYEDNDFYLRLYESNLSMYITEEVPYIRSASSWNYERSKGHFFNKWGDTSNLIKRRLEDETYSYNFGPTTNQNFLEWKNSYITPMKVKRWFMRPMIIKGEITPPPLNKKGNI
jgi:GT2 family glycosyltransferase